MNHEERDFTKQVIALAKVCGWRTAHFRPGMMANGRWITAFSGDGKGFPDLVMVRNKRLLFVELKTASGELSEEQILWMYDLDKTGVEIFKWTPNDWEEIKKELQ